MKNKKQTKVSQIALKNGFLWQTLTNTCQKQLLNRLLVDERNLISGQLMGLYAIIETDLIQQDNL